MATAHSMRPGCKWARITFGVAAWVTALAGSAGAADLARPGPRQGYYLGIGAAGAVGESRDDELGRRTVGGGVLSLRVGQMANEWLGFGVGVDRSVVQGERWRDSAVGFTLNAQLLAWRHLACHGGLGLGAVRARDRSGRVEESRGTGPAYYTAGLSYDFFPWYEAGSGGLALTPSVQIRHFPGESFRATILSAGIEVVYWFGWNRRELDAPDDWRR